MEMADTVIRNVSIVDGTGSKMFGGDVVIDEGRIIEVGSATSKCNEEVDGSGFVLAPGFVDVHTHDDGALIQHPGMAFKVSQGCTSVVVGNCGFSAVPAVNGEKTLDLSNIESHWQDLEGYRRVVEDGNVVINSMMLMGHNTIRSLEMKNLRDQPTDKQLENMRQHVQKGMEQGACGLSTGLVYKPGRWSQTEEIIELAKVVSPFRGIYATHMRNENDQLLEAVDEALLIGKEAQVAVQISHHKAAGKANWGKVGASLSKIDAAVAAGRKVTLDVYPYTAGSGPMIQYFNLANPDKELAEAIQLASCPAFRQYEGRMLIDIADELGISPEDAVVLILTAPEGAKTICIQHVMNEADVITNLEHSLVMIGSDGLPDLEGRPHPRLYGTFPRVLGKYVREQKIVHLEEAVRRMTSLSCDVHGLKDRGRVAVGKWADLVLFNPNQIVDTATYEEPQQEAVGVQRVWVNGRSVYENGRHTGVGGGRVLRYNVA